MRNKVKPLCYCFNISHDDVYAYFADGTKSVDCFVQETRFGTKCTACLLDLDVCLDNVFSEKQKLGINVGSGSKINNSGLLAFKTFTDSGFCLNKHTAKTLVSLQNYDQCFEVKNAAIDFQYHMIVFSECGAVVDSVKGKLLRNNGIVLEASQKLGHTESGWFILKLRGLNNGYFGTMRPQVLFKSDKWTASYHTQPHYMASCYGHRSGVAVRVTKTGSNASFHLINASRRKNQVSVQLLQHTDSKPVSFFTVTLGGSAGVKLSFNDVVEKIPEPGIYNVLINSKYPTRKHILNELSDGSYSVDHFPN